MGSIWCLISLLTNPEWTSFIMLWMFIIFAMYCTHISIPSNLFFSLSISILTLEKYTTKIYKTLIKCWYSWFQHSQSQWPYMESKQQLVITMSKACIHCELCFITILPNRSRASVVQFLIKPNSKDIFAFCIFFQISTWVFRISYVLIWHEYKHQCYTGL